MLTGTKLTISQSLAGSQVLMNPPVNFTRNGISNGRNNVLGILCGPLGEVYGAF